jgi:CheY-like chemotaxis protein
MPPRNILIVGDYDHPEFEPATTWVRRQAEVMCFREAAHAASHAAAAKAELILFAQSRPGRFCQDNAELLHRAAPLARLAVMLGPWCEGEMRSGTPLSGVVRIYWHEWRAKLELLWESRDDQATWDLPRTSLAGERTLAASEFAEAESRQLIAVRARTASSYAPLADVLQSAGYVCLWLDSRQPLRARPAALLWEGDLRVPDQRGELSRLAAALRPAPTIVLASFLRGEDRRLAIAAGAVDIMSKPFLVSDLIRRLRAALDSSTMLAADERA